MTKNITHSFLSKTNKLVHKRRREGDGEKKKNIQNKNSPKHHTKHQNLSPPSHCLTSLKYHPHQRGVCSSKLWGGVPHRFALLLFLASLTVVGRYSLF